MESRYMLIRQVNKELKNWMVRVTITEDVPKMRCRNGSYLKRYILTDEEGTTIVATVFDADIPALTPRLHLFRTYDIGNAYVKFVNPEYRILGKPYQWALQRSTLIRPVPEVPPNVRYILDGITPIGLLNDSMIYTNESIDVMAVVIKAGERKTTDVGYGPTEVQTFLLINSERKPIILSLWGDMASSVGPVLEHAARDYSVVLAKRLAVKPYRGISLASKASSSFTVDPPAENARALKAWFESVQEAELEQFLVDQTIPMARERVANGTMRINTNRAIEASSKSGDFWVQGTIAITDDSQQLHYTCCSNCFRTIRADHGHDYTCFLCHQPSVATLRLLVAMELADGTGAIDVVAIDNIAEKVLQTTVQGFERLLNMQIKYDLASIKSEFEGKTFNMLLRRTFTRRNEGQKRLLMIDYYNTDEPDMPIPTITNAPTPRSTSASTSSTHGPGLTMSPLKRQLETLTPNYGSPSKKLSMTDVVQDSEKSDGASVY